MKSPRSSAASLYELSARTLDGDAIPLSRYRGKTLVIVNVASRCGFTPQYNGLEDLYRRFKSKGLVVLGFPCDQFGQEPGDAEEIRRFCSLKYQVTFPLFAKIEVNGPGTHPLYQLLKTEQPGVLGSQTIKWNFTKFLVGPDGRVVRRYAPADPPERIEEDLMPILGT
jgi:glutathione peroxidase